MEGVGVGLQAYSRHGSIDIFFVCFSKVEVGRVYEIVVSTWEGLYRYGTEDLVEIIGFYGTVPKYKFVRR